LTLLRREGVGVLVVQLDDVSADQYGRVRQEVSARFTRTERAAERLPARHGWLQALRATASWCSQHRNIVPAGTNRAGFWTPYKGTIDDVRGLLSALGECTIGQIMARLSKHHYRADATARACIAKALACYETDWCHAEHRDGAWRFRLRTPIERAAEPRRPAPWVFDPNASEAPC
jgi:hypothetical protein